MKSSELLFCMPWGEVGVPATDGGKQGATESPAMFSRIMDFIFEPLPESGAPILPGVRDPGAGFMDDAVLWAKTAGAMQMLLTRVGDMTIAPRDGDSHVVGRERL